MRKILRKKAKIFLRFSLFSPPKDELILSGLLVGVDNLARWVQVEEKDNHAHVDELVPAAVVLTSESSLPSVCMTHQLRMVTWFYGASGWRHVLKTQNLEIWVGILLLGIPGVGLSSMVQCYLSIDKARTVCSANAMMTYMHVWCDLRLCQLGGGSG